ncbi:MAG: hypothetical protein M0R48_00935 [Candidatus Omnitrophica bacterium]|jgi:hypothetical protein|nr:hypothetical protein [Candidatus Omnitrophota bacterium]
MDTHKTKSMKNIEEQMQNVGEDSLRYHVLESAKNFKTSWVALGRSLYTVWKDKLYKDWGFNTLEGYTSKEIGIKKLTAMKLLRSYYFLEKEEPQYLSSEYAEQAPATTVPTYESVDLLRKAKNNKILDNQDYANLKKDIFEKGRDAQVVKKDLTNLIRQRKEIDPEESHEKERVSVIKRYLSVLKSMKKEIEISKLLPPTLLKETESLIKKLEEEVS